MVFDFHLSPFVGFNRFKPSSKIFFSDRSKADHLCYFCLVFVMLSCASV